ncbi:MAG: hypothetical protein JSV86_05400 [Gemmatimonadota bacterium]|nr:MAG: hypothetical protein JSV86_05400 [Gemmatimonadota bacterium]
MLIRKPTQIYRATVVQEARIIVEPEHDAGPGSYRRVQLLIPPSPAVFAQNDVLPEDLGPNRHYKLPRMAPGQKTDFHLLPHQFITAAAAETIAEVSVIVEYL